MEQNKKATELVVRLGVRFGLVFIIINLIKFHFKLELMSLSVSAISWFLGLGLYIGILLYSVKRIRDEVFEGYINFASALSYGTGAIFVGVFLSSVVSFVYFQWVDPFYVATRSNVVAEMMLQAYVDLNAGDEIISAVQQMVDNADVPTAAGAASGQLVSNISLGFIVGLVVSLILRRNKPSQL